MRLFYISSDPTEFCTTKATLTLDPHIALSSILHCTNHFIHSRINSIYKIVCILLNSMLQMTVLTMDPHILLNSILHVAIHFMYSRINSSYQILNFSLHLWYYFTYHQILLNPTLQTTTWTMDPHIILSSILHFTNHFINNQVIQNSILSPDHLRLSQFHQILIKTRLYLTNFIMSDEVVHNEIVGYILATYQMLISHCIYETSLLTIRSHWILWQH